MVFMIFTCTLLLRPDYHATLPSADDIKSCTGVGIVARAKDNSLPHAPNTHRHR